MSHLLAHLIAMFAVALVATQLAIFATTIYLHRTLAHRAMSVRTPVSLAFRAVLWLTVGMKPREWVAVHRKHHAFTDGPADPHSPAQLGWLRVQLTNAALYRRVARDGVTVARYARDVPRDRWDRLVFDHAFVGLGLGVALLCVMLGVWWGLGAAVLHTVGYLQLAGAVNSVGHTFGERPHGNSATNLQSLALVTAGEGLHNNHHAAPTSARLSLQRGELDPGWWVICALRKLGLAKIRHDKVALLPPPTERAA